MADLKANSEIVGAENIVGSDSDKSGAENPTNENCVVAEIWVDSDIVVVDKNCSDYFVDSL